MLATLWETLALGMRNLSRYPLRTALTMLGIVFGVSSVILMRAVGAGAEAEILREFGKLGIDNVIVNSVKPPEKKRETNRDGNWINRNGLRFKDADRIQATVPGVKRVLPVHSKKTNVWSGSHRVEATVYGVTSEHLPLLGLDVSRGRTLSDLDDQEVRRVCVIRPGLFKEISDFEDPLGKDLRVGKQSYRVVGILKDDRLFGYASKALAVDYKSNEVYVPFHTLLRREGTMSITEKTGSFEANDVELNQLVIGVANIDSVILVSKLINAALAKFHEEKDYEIVVPIEYLKQRQKTQDVFNYAFLAIASISLLVGGIGIANIMLATVTERTKEIGIRRALGAKRRDIVLQFLGETTMIASIGGLIGVGAGFFFDWALRHGTGWTTIISPQSIFVGLLVSMAVGIVSGIFPARRAAYLDPIAALRHS